MNWKWPVERSPSSIRASISVIWAAVAVGLETEMAALMPLIFLSQFHRPPTMVVATQTSVLKVPLMPAGTTPGPTLAGQPPFSVA